MSLEDRLKSFTVDLYKANGIKFGEYKTKVGLMTPVYCDLRVIISYPSLLRRLRDIIVEYMKNLEFDLICGVPYTALPIATSVSMKTDIPMLMKRKEAKDYGTKKLIEGVYNDGDQCLIIEDVVTSGSSILETAKDLRTAGLKCSDAIVVLNREQGGETFLQNNSIKMHALLTLSKSVSYLREAGLINDDTVREVETYLQQTKVDVTMLEKPTRHNRLELTFENRSNIAKNSVSKSLFTIMATKKTNLCVAADLTSATDILNLAEQIGPHICALKTHIDIVEDFHENFIKHLKNISEKHNFVLFEDRKYADIGETVRLQYTKGLYKVSSWAKLVTAHSLTGKGVLDALNQSQDEKGVFLLAQTSAAGSLINDNYTNETIKLAQQYPELVVGIVCQSPLFVDHPELLQLTPGVRIDQTEDSLGQRYESPESVVIERGGDIAVVGRGITKAADPETAAIEYKSLLWDAYIKRTKSS